MSTEYSAKSDFDLPSGLSLPESQILGLISHSEPGGRPQANGLNGRIISAGKLHVSGDVVILGTIKSPLNLQYGIRFPDGSLGSPSITFINDPSVGLYRDGLSVGVSGPLSADEITTPGGNDLVLNPSGSNIDCSGKNLINVAGLALNPFRYDVVAPSTIDTFGTVPAELYRIPTVAGSIYSLDTEVTLYNVTDNASYGNVKIFSRAKNVLGFVSIAPNAEVTSSVDNGLIGSLVTLSTTGNDVIVNGQGIFGTTVRWFGCTTVTKCDL